MRLRQDDKPLHQRPKRFRAQQNISAPSDLMRCLCSTVYNEYYYEPSPVYSDQKRTSLAQCLRLVEYSNYYLCRRWRDTGGRGENGNKVRRQPAKIQQFFVGCDDNGGDTAPYSPHDVSKQ